MATIIGQNGHIGDDISDAVNLGAYNTNMNNQSTAIGGTGNLASGTWSYAFGYFAQSIHDNAFVWSSGATPAYESHGVSTFNVKADGGIYLDSIGGTVYLNGVAFASESGGSIAATVGSLSTSGDITMTGNSTLYGNLLYLTNGIRRGWTLVENPTSAATNYVISSTNSRVLVNLTNTASHFTMTDLEGGREGTIMFRAVGVNSVISTPTNYAWLSTNGFALTGSSYTLTLTNGKVWAVSYMQYDADATNNFIGAVASP